VGGLSWLAHFAFDFVGRRASANVAGCIALALTSHDKGKNQKPVHGRAKYTAAEAFD
jgi:hypothetical protein